RRRSSDTTSRRSTASRAPCDGPWSTSPMARRDFLLPDLGEGLEEAEIVKWLVNDGDAVTLNQPLVEVNTAKALVEIPSPFAGTVVQLHGGEGDIVLVGNTLVTFEVEGAPDQ